MDKQKFEILFKDQFVPLCYFGQKYIPDLDTTKEIVHEVFVNLWERRNELDTKTSLKSYLYTSVRNRCLNYIRDHKKFISEEIDEHDMQDPELLETSDFLEEQETVGQIFKAVQELPEKCREIFELNRFEGLKYNDVAEKLGISVKTVETQMSKALRILRVKLSRYITLLLTFLLLWLKNL